MTMSLHWIDTSIIIVYLIAVVLMGIWLRNRAGEGLSEYFLGGRSIPWYLLGMSNASSMFDVTGTMWMVTILFVYGAKAIFLPWLWPTFNQVFLMVYLAVWIRRSGVMTGGEWIGTRFGKGRGAEMSRIAVVVFALLMVISFLMYAYQGVGRFAAGLLPWDLTPTTYAIILMSITTIYVILGGMLSVVLTDVFQFAMLTIASLIIGVIAIIKVSPEALAAVTPDGWQSIGIGRELNIHWHGLIPQIDGKIASDGYWMFGMVWMMMLTRGFFSSMAGTAPNYDMQRVLATKRPRDSALMSAMVSVLLIPRWLLIAGITTLGLVFFSDTLSGLENIDFEMIMPWVIRDFVPIGVTGLIVAGLLAAYMSTFDSTVNAGAAYVVNDIYRRYINPDASEKRLIWMSYGASILIVVIGLIFGATAESIHQAMGWIVSGLFAGFTVPNILKWHWWRFNGYGYFWGMMGGMGGAMILAVILPDGTDLLWWFPAIMGVGLVSSVAASLLTQADDMETLKQFYKTVRPWGYWGPVVDALSNEDKDWQTDANSVRDLTNVVVGIIWQTALVLIPVYLVLQNYSAFSLSFAVAVLLSWVLKRNWYDKLAEED